MPCKQWEEENRAIFFIMTGKIEKGLTLLSTPNAPISLPNQRGFPSTVFCHPQTIHCVQRRDAFCDDMRRGGEDTQKWLGRDGRGCCWYCILFGERKGGVFAKTDGPSFDWACVLWMPRMEDFRPRAEIHCLPSFFPPICNYAGPILHRYCTREREKHV